MIQKFRRFNFAQFDLRVAKSWFVGDETGWLEWKTHFIELTTQTREKLVYQYQNLTRSETYFIHYLKVYFEKIEKKRKMYIGHNSNFKKWVTNIFFLSFKSCSKWSETYYFLVFSLLKIFFGQAERLMAFFGLPPATAFLVDSNVKKEEKPPISHFFLILRHFYYRHFFNLLLIFLSFFYSQTRKQPFSQKNHKQTKLFSLNSTCLKWWFT